MSNHATTFHYRQSSLDLLTNGQVQITKAFKPTDFDLSDIDWAMDPISSKSWRLYLHSLDWLHALRYSAQVNQSEEDLTHGLDIIRDWWEFNEARTQPETMAWDDHATSNRLANLCFWLALSNEHGMDCSWLEPIIQHHVEVVNGFFENGHWVATNHAIFHIASLVNVRIACPNAMLGTAYEDLTQRYLKASMSSLLHTDSGFSVEQSLFYHQFVLDELVPLQQVLSYDEGIDGETLDEMMQKMKSFIHTISTRSGRVPALGDTTYGFEIKPTHRPLDPPPNGIYDFPQTGLAVLRGGSGEQEHVGTFSYPATRASHGHFSPLHVTLIHGGRKFIVDSGGSYAYGESFRFSYIMSQSAHNVPLLYGSNSKEMAEKPSPASQSQNLVQARMARDDGDVRRAVLMLEKDCFCVMDRITLPTKGSVQIPWHLADDVVISSAKAMDLNYSTNGVLLSDSSDHAGLELCSGDHSISMGWKHSQPGRTRIVSGILDPSPQGWVTKGHRQRTPAPVVLHEFEVEQLVTLSWWAPPGYIVRVVQSADAVFEIDTNSGGKHCIRWDADEPSLS
tara:strand:- start:81 stop:1772 length:1692 start_codon:yes stop_codon:yes gene_type:complete